MLLRENTRLRMMSITTKAMLNMSSIGMALNAPSPQLPVHLMANGGDALQHVLANGLLNAVFQPIISLKTGAILGVEGLIRGPSQTPIESPSALFSAARRHDLLDSLDAECRRCIVSRYANTDSTGKLFINVLPSSLLALDKPRFDVAVFLEKLSLHPGQIVIEVTESQPFNDFHNLRNSLNMLRAIGFQIAIDDLGEGYASLRLWSELRPDYVKIDKHFIRGLHEDGFKQQFVRAIQQISHFTNTAVIAEGVETIAELMTVRDLGIEFAQGFLIGKPEATPVFQCPDNIAALLDSQKITVLPSKVRAEQYGARIGKLVDAMLPAAPVTPNEDIMQRFTLDPSLAAIPVVINGVPLGLIRRARFVQEFARPYRHELYDKRPCTLFMDNDTLVVEVSQTITSVSELLTEVDRRHLASGFIITENGRYLGVGSGQALLRELTELQINTARYSNPLTMLPGNVPIAEHVDRLLIANTPFVAAYCDIDYFKPFNDLYGYRKGDDMIRALADSLNSAVDPNIDFVGHIGGDDFIVHLQSPDWQARMQAVIDAFADIRKAMLSADDLQRGSYQSENRQGVSQDLPLPSLSIGAMSIDAKYFGSHQDVSIALANVKREAKRIKGDTLFIERRVRQAVPGLDD